MSKSYPIWINVNDSDSYKNDKSFGSKGHVSLDIKVGSSKTLANTADDIHSTADCVNDDKKLGYPKKNDDLGFTSLIHL